MAKQFVSIWFRHLITDWFCLQKPELRNVPFVLAAPVRGRMIITAANTLTESQGISSGMAVADARALLPGLQVLDDIPDLNRRLLKRLAEWCIRFTPVTAIDGHDSLVLDTTGCAHLWGGERAYLKEIIARLKDKGYYVRAAMAGTIGAAWAVSRYGRVKAIIEPGEQIEALLSLPPAALRLEQPVLERLHKLGLYTINSFISMPRKALRRRFGEQILLRLDQALGNEAEYLKPVIPVEPYREWLPCLEPIVTATGIEIAVQKLLETLCLRLQKEGKGMRTAVFKGYRVDGDIQQVSIGTNKPSRSVKHLFKLFEVHIGTIEPALGFELFVLEATKVEDVSPLQEAIWGTTKGLEDTCVAELLDRISVKLSSGIIKRYLPDEHYWPERSYKQAVSLQEKPTTEWRIERPRPVHLLTIPETIEVMVPVPDYPPLHFLYKGKLHIIKKADGPERIEREWWLEKGQHRDYYYVEDEDGGRYWLYRLGHYDSKKPPKWFIHGFFG